jgi:flagellar protein FlgJ
MDITPLQKTVAVADIAPERLASNTELTDQQKISEASRQFEAILLRQILAATQKTIIPSKFADNSASADIYRDMITTQLADSISKSGSFGLAKTFEHQLTRPTAGVSRSLGAPASRRPLRAVELAGGTPALPGSQLPAKPLHSGSNFHPRP